jgi:hypothetical protein
MPQTIYSHPNFLMPVGLDSDGPYKLYDHYHQYQWHIKKVTGQFNMASV